MEEGREGGEEGELDFVEGGGGGGCWDCWRESAEKRVGRGGREEVGESRDELQGGLAGEGWRSEGEDALRGECRETAGQR